MSFTQSLLFSYVEICMMTDNFVHQFTSFKVDFTFIFHFT